MNNKKTTILIIAVIVLFFVGVAVAAVKLSKNEEKTQFTVSPITKPSSKKPTGLFVNYSDKVQSLDPSSAEPLEKDILTISSLKNNPNYSSSEMQLTYISKISPDGKYLAVLTPEPFHINYSDQNPEDSTIILYDLSDNTSKKVVVAAKDTLITSIAWDWSSKSIGFITTKRLQTSNIDNPLNWFIPNQENYKKYLNSVDITSGNFKTQDYPEKSKEYSYGDGAQLLALNGDTYYIYDRSQLITLVGTSSKLMEISDSAYSNLGLYFSPDYQLVAFLDTFQIILVDLKNKTKQNFQTSTGNIQSIKILGFAISPDHQSLAFIKSAPLTKVLSGSSGSAYSSPYQNDSSSPTTIETIWYYSIKTKTFEQVLSQSFASESYSYTSTSSLAFSPDSSKLDIISSESSANKPLVNQTLSTYNIKDKSIQKTPIPYIGSIAKILTWQ